MTEKQLELLRHVSQMVLDNRNMMVLSASADFERLRDVLSEVESEAFSYTKQAGEL